MSVAGQRYIRAGAQPQVQGSTTMARALTLFSWQSHTFSNNHNLIQIKVHQVQLPIRTSVSCSNAQPQMCGWMHKALIMPLLGQILSWCSRCQYLKPRRCCHQEICSQVRLDNPVPERDYSLSQPTVLITSDHYCEIKTI